MRLKGATVRALEAIARLTGLDGLIPRFASRAQALAPAEHGADG
jgi:hypothetical protein